MDGSISPERARGALMGLVLSGEPLPPEVLDLAGRLTDEQLAGALSEPPCVQESTTWARGDRAHLQVYKWDGGCLLPWHAEGPLGYYAAAIVIHAWLAHLWEIEPWSW